MPIFFALGTLALVIFFGWLAPKLKILSAEHTRGMSAYIYYFALPALFFAKIARLDLAEIDPKIVVGSLAPIFALLIFLIFLRFAKILSKENFVLVALAVVFGSNAFFGITFFEALAGESGLEFAVISSSVLGPVGIILTIYLFEYATARGNGWCFCGKIFQTRSSFPFSPASFFQFSKSESNRCSTRRHSSDKPPDRSRFLRSALLFSRIFRSRNSKIPRRSSFFDCSRSPPSLF